MSEPGAMLREARESAGISLAVMANRTHFSESHLSNVERGRRTASPDIVVAYERVLGEDVRGEDC